MRLLLLLSALLAALSGVGANARAPHARAVAVAAQIVDSVPERAHAHVLLATRPAAALAATSATALPTVALRASPRLWAQRRRE